MEPATSSTWVTSLTNPFTSWWDAGYFFELPYADG